MKNLRNTIILLSITFISMIVSTPVLAESNEDLFLNQKVTYSGVEGGKKADGSWVYPQFIGENAVDGKSATRWSADKLDEQWLIIDMGEEKSIEEIVVDFHAESPSYSFSISSDDSNYVEIFKTDSGSNGTSISKTITIENQSFRYLKYNQNKMWKHSGNSKYYGSSIISISGYSKKNVAESISLSPSSITLSKNRNSLINYTIYPESVDILPSEIIWTTSDEAVASVSNGEVIANNEGTAVITATIDGTDISGTTRVEVKESDPTYTLMRERWKKNLIGDNNSQNTTEVKEYSEKINSEALTLSNTLNKENDRTVLWEKLSSDTVSANYTTQFTKIKKLTMSYYNKNSELYGKQEVYNEIISAIQFMENEKKYNGTYSTGNWWDWQIGSAQPLTDTLLLLHDDLLKTDYTTLVEMTTPLTKYASNPTIQWPSYKASGANLTDISLTVLGTAILMEDSDRMQLVVDNVPSVLKFVTSGDGLYVDGSVIQHTFISYNGSYGNELLKGVGKVQSILVDTDWEIKDSNFDNLFQVVEKGYLELMTSGRMPSMVSGRSITREPGTNPFTTEFDSGKETISNLLLIAKFSPSVLQNNIYGSIKSWVNETGNIYNYYDNPRDFGAIADLVEVMNDETILAEENKKTLNVYNSMDRVFQKNEFYSIGISMYSKRVGNYEFINTENKHGWHTSDGMFYLYNNDYNQFGEGYWATIDLYRLPGTTVDTRNLVDGSVSGKRSPQSQIGGTVSKNEKFAAIGMFLDKANEGMDLTAKKSWFLLDDSVVNLGSGIAGTTESSIETIIENRMIDTNINSVSYGNDKEIKKSIFENDEKQVEDWINLNGETTEQNIGYIFPSSISNISSYSENRSGKYSDINGYFVNDIEYSKDFFVIRQSYGKTVSNENYEYLTVPGKTDEEIQAMSKNNHYELLSNTSDLQAIRYKQTVLANAWVANTSFENFALNSAMSIIINKTQDNILEISLSNPSQDNSTISATFLGDYESVISQDEGISIDDNVISLNSNGLYGSSRTIILKLNSINITELEYQLDLANKKIKNDYSDNSWEIFESVKNVAENVFEDESVTQKEVDNAVSNLKKAISSLELKMLPESISLNIPVLKTLKVGKTLKVESSILPEEANQSVVWSTSVKVIVSVDTEGNIRGLKPGIVVISCETVNNLKKSFTLRITQ